jgi:hypothetical protein
MVNLFINIDGVFLGKSQSQIQEVATAYHAKKSIGFALKNSNYYWLTNHSKGSNTHLLEC